MKLWFILSFILVLRESQAESVCYGELGCFTDEPPFGDTEGRPLKQLPNDPEKINARFYLDTRSEINREVYNDNMADLGTTSFNPSKETKFIVHGFLHNGEVKFMTDTSEALLTVGDYNVVRVGWIGGSLTLNYAQAAVDTQVTGAEIGLFIKNTMAHFGVGSDGFHCIGHSLGAQTCGYAGAYVQTNVGGSKIGRISGLDPAGPYFEGSPEEVRLDASDASFVDVIHSDAEKLTDLGFGTNQISGHVDFWPNNGLDQPGCNLNALSTVVSEEGIKIGAQDFFACSHLRGAYFYVDSITSQCPYTAVQCSSYDDYVNGKCLTCPNGVCTSMGFNAVNTKDNVLNSPTANFYLQTGAFRPYCEYPFYVRITLGNVGDSINGYLYLALFSSEANSELQMIGNEDQELDLRPATTFYYLAHFRTYPSPLNKVKVLWADADWSIIGSNEISVAKVELTSISDQQQFSFCGDANQKLSEEVRYVLQPC